MGPIEASNNECKRCGFSISCDSVEAAALVQQELDKANRGTEFSVGMVCVAGQKILGYIELYTESAMRTFKKIVAKLKKTLRNYGDMVVTFSCEVCARVKDEFGLDEFEPFNPEAA